MKYTTEELLLAATVRTMALALQQAQRKRDTAAPPLKENLPDHAYQPGNEAMLEQADAQRLVARQKILSAQGDWDAAHPLSEFIPKAMAQLREVVDVIRLA